MKKSVYLLFIAAIVSMAAVCVKAAETVSEVLVIEVKGSAKAFIPGSTTPVDVKVGNKLPQGTVLETADGSQVQLEVFPGILTTVEPASRIDLSKLSLTTSEGVVTKRTAVVGLQLGSVFQKLDPSKKAINDYSVSTPKGVASARGTQYTVTLQTNGSYRIDVQEGSVLVTPKVGNPVTLKFGYYIILNEDGTITGPTKYQDGEASPSTDTNGNQPTTSSTSQKIDNTIVSPSS